jgi:hypothetical protein
MKNKYSEDPRHNEVSFNHGPLSLIPHEEILNSKRKNPSNIRTWGAEPRISRYSPRGLEREKARGHFKFRIWRKINMASKDKKT